MRAQFFLYFLRMNDEAYISSEQGSPKKNSRLSLKNENDGWSQGSQPKTQSRQKKTRSLKFSSDLKIKKRSDYKNLFKQRQRLVGSYFCIDWRKTERLNSRLGLSVSSRYGNAVDRNRFKRCMREAFRLSRRELPPSLDLNIIPRQRAKKALSTSLRSELTHLITEALSDVSS